MAGLPSACRVRAVVGGCARAVAAPARGVPVVAVVVASFLLMALLVVAHAPDAMRLVVALWLLGACAGLAWAPLLGVGRSLGAGVTVLGISLAADVLVASALMYLGLGISALDGLLALALVSAPGCAMQVRRRHQGWAEPG